MKTNLLKNVLVASVMFVAASSALAEGPQKIRIDHFPYVGTLVDVAQAVDQELTEEAVKVCGSIQNVKLLDAVTIKLPAKLRAHNWNRQNNGDANFSFAYPRVQATAIVHCK